MLSLQELLSLSRRDERIQPGVLTPGTDEENGPPRRGGRVNLVDWSRNEIRNDLSAALSGRVLDRDVYLGLKPQAESFHPFGISPTSHQGKNIPVYYVNAAVAGAAINPKKKNDAN